MIRQIVSDYLGTLRNEREFDAPFVALLGALGYSNVFLTHGQHELGKDFIAQGDGGQTQFSFQSKRGDLTGAEWQSTVQHQVVLAADSGLPHPGFNHSLPIKAILVLTGELKGNAQLGIDALNRTRASQGKSSIEVWNRSRLVELILTLDSTILYSLDPRGYEGYGQFFREYGASISGQLDEREFEKHSRSWSTSRAPRQALFVATMEAHAVAEQATQKGQLYEAFGVILTTVREAVRAWYSDPDNAFFAELVRVTAESACAYAIRYCESLASEKGRGTAEDVVGQAAFITSRVTSLRHVEALAIVSLLSADEDMRKSFAARLAEAVENDSFSHEPLSDRFAVSVIVVVKALWDHGLHESARKYITDVARWLFSAYAERAGLGDVEDDELEAAQRALYPESCKHRDSSLIVTALIDLAAYIGDSQLYDNIINDIGACEVIPEYYRAPETIGQFAIESDEVEMFVAGVQPRQPLSPFAEFRYSEHIAREPALRPLAIRFGSAFALAISLLLRDRWFPTSWVSPARVED